MGFQQGLSGLNGSAKNLDVIGNNIANASTVGFKASSTHFADVYSSSLFGGSVAQPGVGTSVAAIAQNFGQGNNSVTSNPLDLAINGEGFFRMELAGAVSYTRNGQFHLDKPDANGLSYIVNNNGLQLTGYGVDASGNVSAANPGPIQVSFANIPPNVTTESALVFNVDSTQTALAVAVLPSDATTYHHSSGVTAYDSLGNAHAITFYFQKTAANTWDVYGDLDGLSGLGAPSLNGGAALTTLTFDATGAMTTAMPFNLVTTTLTASHGANELSVDVDFTGSTQYGSLFGVSTVAQDGYASGRLVGLNVSENGTVQGRYTNGQNKTLGQVATAYFANTRGLQAIGNNQWVETAASGQPTVGTPGSGTLGTVQSGRTEDSNVDLTLELVNLIVAQRMYQANAQTVKAQDQVLSTLVNLR